MRVKMLVFLFFNFFIDVFGQAPPPPMSANKKFTMNFMSPVYACSDEDSLAFIDPSDLETTRVNETCATMAGQIVFHKPFEHSTMAEVMLSRELSGKYEMVFSLEICDICAEIEDPESDYATYLAYCGFPDKCPFAAGSYPINDLIAATENIPMNSVTAGTYLVNINFYKTTGEDCKDERIFLGCIKLDVAIEPV